MVTIVFGRVDVANVMNVRRHGHIVPTATAQYKWTMTYVLGGQEYTESGRDLFVIARRDKKWLAVWRAMLPDPAPDAP